MGSIVTGALLKELNDICKNGVETDVDLSKLSQWRIGGLADVVVRPTSHGEIVNLRELFHSQDIPHVVIGATSNLLFDDDGLRIPCIQIGNQLSSTHIEANKVRVEAGAWVPGLARKIMMAGLTGAEHTCGIPGTIGGLICMNGGSQRKGIGDNVTLVTSVDSQGRTITRTRGECGFEYRKSIFQGAGEIITNVELDFASADSKSAVRQEMLSILKSRRNKFPWKHPNCGSVFKSNPAMYDKVGPPGAVIERLGFKGYRHKSVMVSPLHANFITHDGNGRAEHVRELIQLIHDAVFEDTGFSMDVEVEILNVVGKSNTRIKRNYRGT